MGKAKQRRNRYKQKYLIELAEKDLAKFQEEWYKKLDSWFKLANMISKNEHSEISRNNEIQFNKPLVRLINNAWDQLNLCNEQAKLLVEDATKDFEHYCCQLISNELDPRLYRLTFHYEKNQIR